MDTALTWFTRIWVGVIFILNVMAIIGFFVTADSFWHGWQRVAEIYSPFNVWNFIAEVVSLSPAIAAYMWLEKRRKRNGPPKSQHTD